MTLYIVVREGVLTRETHGIFDNLYAAIVVCQELFDKQEDMYHTFWVYEMGCNEYIKYDNPVFGIKGENGYD